ncbi:RNA-directed DNA polymerase [Nocardioides sp. YIM 152315]|uniref:RNA-directed DNA polymerase n=1 Tax=Nocardioides sp. YIM 152315 TaxID=3031760 RepID=UPI0023DC477C|nr:RNA-directed DNA polymerase [Nocardioides sp. YIM 152315]MDF1602264.1 reverse transcriptase domain-containing protein [Nocardioides sp. YIM 152315]
MRREPTDQRALSGYAAALGDLDLRDAVARGLTRNDLLPKRPDDKAGGEVANRFVASLTRDLELGRYAPSPASFVPVPKVNNATRLAALMTLSDRAVYFALVEPLRARIEQALISNDQLLWPRAIDKDKAWSALETTPLDQEGAYIVLADVSSFYESIDHDLLAARLVELTGNVAVVQALREFLGEIMGARRGIPQGLDVSDVLATAYLSSVDGLMSRSLWPYFRHGDDVRIVVPDHGAGRQALHLFETGLRSVGLTLNGQKSRILLRDTYQSHLTAVNEEREALREKIASAREAALEHATEEELAAIVVEAGIDEDTQWGLFYHGSVTLEDIIDQLRGVLQPTDVEVARAVFDEATSHAPDQEVDPLADEVFHVYLSTTLTRLAAGLDPHAVPLVASLIERFPDKTELLATYLRSVRSTDPEAVAAQVEAALSTPYLFAWQLVWLLDTARLLATEFDHLEFDQARAVALRVQGDEEIVWLARAAAARYRCLTGQMGNEEMERLWRLSPRAVQADLVAGCCDLEQVGPAGWPTRFLDSLKDDAALQVVINRNRIKPKP